MRASFHIKGMKFFAYHGYYPEEGNTGGWFLVDVIFDADISEAAQNDDLKGTIDYQEIYSIVEKHMKERCKLIERVAYNIFEALKTELPRMINTEVIVHKLEPPVNGEIEEAVVKFKGNT